MVDIIKHIPHAATSFPSSTRNLRSKAFNHQITLPQYLSHTNTLSPNDRINNIQTKRWIGKRSSNPPRLLDVSNSPYGLHRKIMYQELSRHGPATSDLRRSAKSKERSPSKDTAKIITTTTTPKTGGTNITPQPSFSTGDFENSLLFDSLSKHVTVKAEPLRPSNSFVNSTTNTLTSWQRYWTSTHAQRRRKEAVDPEPVLHRPKCEQSVPGQTHFVVLRDSTHSFNEIRQYESRTPTPADTDSPIKVYNAAIVSDKPIPPTKENESKKAVPHLSTIEFIASSLIPSSFDINSSINLSKTSTTMALKATDTEDERYLTDQSLLLSSSSHFPNYSEIIENVAAAQVDLKPVITTVYKLSLPDQRSKQTKTPSSRGRTPHPKSPDKKDIRMLSASKRKRQVSVTRRAPNQSELASIITTMSTSKYSEKNWDKPYIGLRFDPPTPPSTPSLCG